MKSISLSEYFSIQRPEYIFLKLTPLKSIRNYDSDKVVKAIASLYKSVTERIKRRNNKYFFTAPCKVSYYIYMEKEKIEFYFILPKEFIGLLKDKINDTWRGITIEQVNEIPNFSNDAVKFYMTYRKEDALSLNADKRNNALLSAILSNVDVMEQGDRIGVFYNFMPCSQASWRSKYDNTINRLKENMPIDRDKKDVMYLVKLLLNAIVCTYDLLLDAFSLSDTVTTDASTKDLLILPETIQKRESRVVKAQILCLSESEDKNRAYNNVRSICESFGSITGDNELISKKTNAEFNPLRYKLKGAENITLSSKEGQSLLSLPGKELIEEYKIKCINTLESVVPDKLKTGIINIGISSYRGTETDVFLTNDKELRNLALCITGANRSGKTTLLANIIDNMLINKECVVLPDFCGNCELSNYLKTIFPNRVLTIDCNDFEKLQGMGYNEINNNEQNVFKRYRNAKMQSIQLNTLINAVNDDSKMLMAKMDRYLEAASLVVFISGGSIRDVLNVLQNDKTRAGFIKSIPLNQKDNLKEYVDSLMELDEKNNAGEVTGTKFNNIAGIIDRITVLKKNTYIELMLKKSCDNNINLLDELQKSQIICIRMPEEMFATSIEKDIFCTYWFSKLWLALQIRKIDIERDSHIKVNIIVDELYQVPKCQDLIASKLSQMPKFTTKLIVTCHYLNQIPVLKEELKASNASYMILQGSNVSNFTELKTEFSNLNYSVDDLLNLKRYNSLNLLSYEGGYWAGVTALPKPKEKFVT